MNKGTEANIGAALDSASAIATGIAPLIPGYGVPIAMVIGLIDKVGWPATKGLLDRYSSDPKGVWTAEDTARVDALIKIPVSAYEAGIVQPPA